MSYGNMPLWQKILIYLVIGGIIYFGIYYFVFANKGGYGQPQDSNSSSSGMSY